MTLAPNDLALFARVVDEGSFSRAAERLGLPKSTVSRRVAALEALLGERLLLRPTRKLTITDFGQAVLEHAHHVVEDVAAAAALAQNRQVQPSGRLRVSMPSDMANLLLAPLLAEFVLSHPAVTLDLDLSARFVDLVGENVDLALRVGPLRDDASLNGRQIASFGRGLYAAPAYLARRGTPADPDELERHDALHVPSRDGDLVPWVLQHGERTWRGTPPGRATANSPELLMRLALGGVGIAMVSDHFALPHLERAELVQVLPEWRVEPTQVWAVFPGRRLMPTRTRAFLEAIAARFASPECEAIERDVQTAKRRLRATRAAPRPGNAAAARKRTGS